MPSGRSTFWSPPRADTGGPRWPRPFHRRPGHLRVGAVPQGFRVAHAGNCSSPAGARTCTRIAFHGSFDDLPAPREGGLRRSGAQEPVSNCRARTPSISAGCLPQAVYLRRHPASRSSARMASRRTFVIPSGNLGNSVACVLGQESWGLPIGRIVLGAQRQSRRCRIFLADGQWRPASGHCDAGVGPWMSARLATWNGCAHCFPELESVRSRGARADSVSDGEIRGAPSSPIFASTGKTWCPPHGPALPKFTARMSPAEARGPGAGCWFRPRIRRNFARNRRTAHRPRESKCRKALLNSCRGPCHALSSKPTLSRLGR